MGPPSRRARCEDALIAQGVSLRLEINGRRRSSPEGQDGRPRQARPTAEAVLCEALKIRARYVIEGEEVSA